uniref:Uncharacterized protein n=2 Tax=Anguilla anguilla TaxID=7936 RepID=A0A0E9PVX5_ANGAN
MVTGSKVFNLNPKLHCMSGLDPHNCDVLLLYACIIASFVGSFIVIYMA